MPQSNINQAYLPLTRNLTYQTNFIINGELLETQTGDIIPINMTDTPITKVFFANNISVTQTELNLLQDFYQTLYLQKFYFTDPKDSQKKLGTLETPNSIITQFTFINDTPSLLYLVNSAKIYVNNQLVTNATINQDLQIIFTNPPASNTVITAVIDYDYAVMFDYDFGLQSIFDNQTQTYKISFKLITD